MFKVVIRAWVRDTQMRPSIKSSNKVLGFGNLCMISVFPSVVQLSFLIPLSFNTAFIPLGVSSGKIIV